MLISFYEYNERVIFFQNKTAVVCVRCRAISILDSIVSKPNKFFVSPELQALPDLLFISIIYRFVGCLLQLVIVLLFTARWYMNFDLYSGDKKLRTTQTISHENKNV